MENIISDIHLPAQRKAYEDMVSEYETELLSINPVYSEIIGDGNISPYEQEVLNLIRELVINRPDSHQIIGAGVWWPKRNERHYHWSVAKEQKRLEKLGGAYLQFIG